MDLLVKSKTHAHPIKGDLLRYSQSKRAGNREGLTSTKKMLEKLNSTYRFYVFDKTAQSHVHVIQSPPYMDFPFQLSPLPSFQQLNPTHARTLGSFKYRPWIFFLWGGAVSSTGNNSQKSISGETPGIQYELSKYLLTPVSVSSWICAGSSLREQFNLLMQMGRKKATVYLY